jgi:DNA repair protein RadD
MFELRNYQRDALDAQHAYWDKGGGNSLIVLPTGSGKSLVMAALCQEVLRHYPTMRIAVATHVRELIAQDYDELKALWPGAPAGIYSAGLKRRDAKARILFCGIQSVWDRLDEIGPVDLLLVDECFPAGTMIETRHGPKPIEDISVGDMVLNALGEGTVEAVKRSVSKEIISVGLSNGTVITCTKNHPFFTPKGFIKAGKLGIGRRVFSVEDMRSLWRDFPAVDQMARRRVDDFYYETGSLEETAVLLYLVLQVCGERYEGYVSADEHEQNIARDWAQAARSWREWKASAQTATGHAGDSRPGVGCGASSEAWSRSATVELQTGFGARGDEDWDRGGRRFSQPPFETGAGPEEGQIVRVAWVDGLQNTKRQGPREVFNLQVSGHPSFFANGILVHNCHLIPRNASTLYQKFITALWLQTPDMRIVGLTATPYRLDSGRLDEGEDRIFETVVYEAPMRRLIDQKYLCPLISKATTQKLDVAGVAMRGGDFIPGQLEIAIDKDWITKGAVNEIVEYGASRSAWLVFCVGVSHALNVAEEIRSRGVSCETVIGNMPRAERDSLIQQFRAGDLKCLVSVMVLGTGFNVPGVDMICLLRPTMSPGLFVQQVGRGSRNADGKANCLVLDFAGNTMRHGPVDLITGTKKRGTGDDEAKECPKCKTLVARGVMECPTCGYAWPVPVIKPRVPRHAILADADNAILADPKPKWVAVGHASYSRHEKFGKPPSLRVDYRCGFNVYSQWICFEHDGYPREKARQWWARNATGAAPLTVAEALARKHQIQPVDEILIERDGKYFKVIGSHTKELAYE